MDSCKNFLRQLNEGFQTVKGRLFRTQEGEKILRERYFQIHGKELDLETPQLFTEKLYHRMIMMHRLGCPTLTRLADKYLARDYIETTVGEQYLVKLLWNGPDPRNIPFNWLPPRSIAKTNHGCGGHLILEAPYHRQQVIETLSKYLKQNYYWAWREPQYYNIPPQVLIEELLDDGHADGPLNYNFWCFNGTPEIVQIDNHHHTINPCYDPTWKKLPFHTRDTFEECDIARPQNLDEMLSVAAALSTGFGFVRVDLYNVAGAVYVGELSFTPSAGYRRYQPEHWDARLGSMWTLEKSF